MPCKLSGPVFSGLDWRPLPAQQGLGFPGLCRTPLPRGDLIYISRNFKLFSATKTICEMLSLSFLYLKTVPSVQRV